MTLTAGARLGHYEIVSSLGAGGMGEVYRAKDTKLDREVAIKLLLEEVSADPELLARFEREAKVLASLNHPNIAGIYGLEETRGKTALILELVEGPTLADRIAQGPVALEEALPIARQIAVAIEAAHEAGVIHRDLKPANIKLRNDGTVKVLDFGLAKVIQPEASAGDATQSPTLTAAATRTGVIIGTAGYMAPEQAKGKVADKRADIWAFGVVLLEMLTGQQVFRGETLSETLAAVMMSEPDWDLLPAGLPATLGSLARHCLHKDPLERMRDMGDVRLVLKWASEASAAQPGVAGATSPQAGRRQALPSLLAVSVISAAVGGLVVWGVMRLGEATPGSATRFAVEAPGSANLLPHMGLAVSPDGRTVIFVGKRGGHSQLYRRTLGELGVLPIPGTELPWVPFFSPDGEWIGYFDQGDSTLKKVRLDGGRPVTICPAPGILRSASWGRDDRIVFGSTVLNGLRRVSAAGGEPEPVGDVEQAVVRLWVDLLPDDQGVLATVGFGDEAEIVVVELSTGEETSLLAGTTARYVQTGHIVYWREGSLWAAPFDAGHRKVTGSPTPVIENVSGPDEANNLADFAVGGSSLVYESSEGAGLMAMVWVDRQGQEEPIAAERRPYQAVALSPEGRRVALEVAEPDNVDLVIYDLERETPTRLTFDPGFDGYPVWTPDGRHVVFTSSRDGGSDLYRKAADGTGLLERLTTSGNFKVAETISPDGKTLLFSEDLSDGIDISVLSLAGDPAVDPLPLSSADETSAKISPDGRWLVYVFREPGQLGREVYVRPFPNVEDGGPWQISREGGRDPRWGPDSREVIFLSGYAPVTVMVAENHTEPTFSPGIPRPLFEGPYPDRGSPYDVTPDGQRFLMIKEGAPPGSASTNPDIIIVENWLEELERLVDSVE